MLEIKKILSKWQTIVVVALIVTAISFTITAFLPPRYQSDISILVIQKQTDEKVDAFSAAKSAEYLSDILARVAYSRSFMEDALSAPFEISREFSSDPERRKEEWKKEIDVKKVNNTGVIEISVFDESKKEAENIANAISWAYSNHGGKYHGGGERVILRLIDGPITSNYPASPNIIRMTLSGLVLGLIGGISLVYFLDFDLSLFRRKSNWESEVSEKIRSKLNLNYPQLKEEDNYFSVKPELDKKEDSNIEIKEGNPFLDLPTEFEKKADIISDKPKNEEKKTNNLVEIKEEQKKEKKDDLVQKNIDKIQKIEENIVSSPIPANLPVFEGSELSFESVAGENEAAFASSSAKDTADKEAKASQEKKKEEEVKERLNKLLRGEL